LTKVYYYIDLLCWTPSLVLSNIWNYTQEHYKGAPFMALKLSAISYWIQCLFAFMLIPLNSSTRTV